MSYDWFRASFLSLSRYVVSAKPITFRRWNENRSSKGRICSSLRASKFLSDAECAVAFIYFSLLLSWSLIKLDISSQIDHPYKFPGTKESVYFCPLCQSECLCETIAKMRFVCKFIFMQIELIVKKKVLHEDSVWGTR